MIAKQLGRLFIINVLVIFGGVCVGRITNSQLILEIITVIENLVFWVSVLIAFILLVFRD